MPPPPRLARLPLYRLSHLQRLRSDVRPRDHGRGEHDHRRPRRQGRRFSRGHICPRGRRCARCSRIPTASVARCGGRGRVEGDLVGRRARRSRLPARRDPRTTRQECPRPLHRQPDGHNHGAILALQGFSRALGTRNRFDANSQDANPKLFASLAMYGDLASITIPRRRPHRLLPRPRSEPGRVDGSVMTLGDVRGRMTDIRTRGGKVVLFDPDDRDRRLVRRASLRPPGGDAALLPRSSTSSSR